jgi:hypothetical protein
MKIFQSFKDNLARLWQGRFRYGPVFNLLGIAAHRYNNGEKVLNINLITIESAGTGHWPWCLAEVGKQWGECAAWHVGLLGFTIGTVRVHDIVDGETAGPDYLKPYFMFKGLNHQQQNLEEIVANAN